MQATVTGSIITGACILFAALIGVWGKVGWDRLAFSKMSAARRQALRGTWSGTAVQPGFPKYSVSLTFYPTRRLAKGEGRFDTDPIVFTGGYLDNNYLKIEYANKNQAVTAYGTVLLNLTPLPTKLDGKFVAYGATSQGPVTGEVSLVKQL